MPGRRKLGRTTDHRNLMLRGLVTYLLENGSITTTLHRAKEVRSLAEKMITLGKEGTLAARRQALAFITKEDVVSKVFSEIAPAFDGVNGGYTAIYKLGPRRGDGAEMALIRLTTEAEKVEKEAAAEEKKSRRKRRKEEKEEKEKEKLREEKREEVQEEAKEKEKQREEAQEQEEAKDKESAD